MRSEKFVTPVILADFGGFIRWMGLTIGGNDGAVRGLTLFKLRPIIPVLNVDMIKEQAKYFDRLSSHLLDFFRKNEDLKIFIFGSSVKSKKFGDIDVGVMGGVSNEQVRELKTYFEESNFPFFVDVINFNEVDESFKKNVLNNQILWIKR